jgi:hypothetical protein
MNKVIVGALAVLFTLFVVLPGISLLSAAILYFIWNGSVHYTLHLPTLGFWQIYFLNWVVGVVGSHFHSAINSKS